MMQETFVAAADVAKQVESAGKGQRTRCFTNRVRDLLPPAVRHKV